MYVLKIVKHFLNINKKMFHLEPTPISLKVTSFIVYSPEYDQLKDFDRK